MTGGRRRAAAELMTRLGVFPREGAKVLEVGCGEGGLLPDFLGFRLAARDLYGIDLDPTRLAGARRRLPGCHFAAADAAALPFAAASFDLVVASTVLSSLLEDPLQEGVAAEIARVLRPGGRLPPLRPRGREPGQPQRARRARPPPGPALPGPRRPGAPGHPRPPLCRALLPRWTPFAALLEGLPFLRSHLLAVLVKGPV